MKVKAIKFSPNYLKAISLILLIIFCQNKANAIGINDLTLFSMNEDGNTKDYSINLQILFFLTILTLLPSIVLCMTCFTRIIIVLTILRQALGLQQTPPNKIVLGLSLFLTIFIMRPILEDLWDNALNPWINEQITFKDALSKAQKPLHAFMLGQTRKNDLDQFVILSGHSGYERISEIPFSTLIPAYITSELKTAFQIGFLIFIPFLIIDLVIASLLMTLGMIMLSPMLVSLPLKLMVFVLVDGWNLMIGSLAHSVNL